MALVINKWMNVCTGPKVTYVPPALPEDEDSVFAHYQQGINFDKYDDIIVDVSGANPVPAIVVSFSEFLKQPILIYCTPVTTWPCFLAEFCWGSLVWIPAKKCQQVRLFKAHPSSEACHSDHLCWSRSHGLCSDRIWKNGTKMLV